MSRSLLAVLAAALLIPAAPRADDWEEWEYQRAGAPYDVSVDLDVQGGVAFETFHSSLRPYGDWVVVGSYGRVWRPHVAAGWRPYYYGRWEWTNEGWFWHSDEPWGWAAYHYGRWAYDPYYGWLWVPGYEWAPAWVSWRYSGDAIGWAPLAPGYSVYVSSYPFIDFWWTFVPSVRFCSVPVHTVAYAPGHARRWYDSTAPAPAYAPRGRVRPAGSLAWGGPAPRFVEQRMGRAVTPSRIVAAPSPGVRGRPGEIPVFRPERPAREAPVRAVQPGRNGWAGGDRNPGRGPGPVAAPGQVDRSPGTPPGRPGPVSAPRWGREERGGGQGAGQGGGFRVPQPRGDGGGAFRPAPSRGDGGGSGGGFRPAPPSRGDGGGNGGGFRPAPSRGDSGHGGGGGRARPAGRGDRDGR